MIGSRCDMCNVFPVIMGRVVGREANAAGDTWSRLTVSIQAVYKRAPRSRLRRGATGLYVRTADLACKCPKLKINKLVSLYRIISFRLKAKIRQFYKIFGKICYINSFIVL